MCEDQDVGVQHHFSPAPAADDPGGFRSATRPGQNYDNDPASFFERRLLGELCRVAWGVVRTVLQSVCGRPDAVPGMIGAIQTFGDLIHFHPHIISFIERGQREVIEKILRHCGLWEEEAARAPPEKEQEEALRD
ncbi:MAG: hypothetical protein O2960_09375 [Verrucomicrobia bacterium]|nr:hypothetical protein [Verrucomicrobiota bacterium]